MKNHKSMRLFILGCSAIFCALLAIYYETSIADSVANYIGYAAAAFGIPGAAGLFWGVANAMFVARMQHEELARLWYFPVTCFVGSVIPILIVILMMSLGPT